MLLIYNLVGVISKSELCMATMTTTTTKIEKYSQEKAAGLLEEEVALKPKSKKRAPRIVSLTIVRNSKCKSESESESRSKSRGRSRSGETEWELSAFLLHFHYCYVRYTETDAACTIAA